MGTRNIQIKCQVTPDEADKLKNHASQCGLTKSALIRMLIQGKRPKPLPPIQVWQFMDTLYDLHGDLRKIVETRGEDAAFARETQGELELLILRLQAVFTLPGKAASHGSDQDMGD
ncbi:MAG: hypothetical protein FWH57_10565 [Oscillospiraceae bacterium]|nr:hypothetical protein [Oscillospiraceae bacterium]